ncbi:MAG: hypothetical protein AB7G80_01530 [Dongiaceae bacterium]
MDKSETSKSWSQRFGMRAYVTILPFIGFLTLMAAPISFFTAWSAAGILIGIKCCSPFLSAFAVCFMMGKHPIFGHSWSPRPYFDGAIGNVAKIVLAAAAGIFLGHAYAARLVPIFQKLDRKENPSSADTAQTAWQIKPRSFQIAATKTPPSIILPATSIERAFIRVRR